MSYAWRKLQYHQLQVIRLLVGSLTTCTVLPTVNTGGLNAQLALGPIELSNGV